MEEAVVTEQHRESAGDAARRDDGQMVVPINGTTYRIVVTPGPLLVRGETTASRVRPRERVIEVDSIIPASDRWRVAALAVAYACRRQPRARFNPVRVVGMVD